MLYVCSLDLFIPQTATLSLLTNVSPSPTSANSVVTTILLSVPVFVLLGSTYEGDHEGIFFLSVSGSSDDKIKSKQVGFHQLKSFSAAKETTK